MCRCGVIYMFAVEAEVLCVETGVLGRQHWDDSTGTTRLHVEVLLEQLSTRNRCFQSCTEEEDTTELSVQ